ncbi:MAG: hypothetical protein LBL65_05080 [Campylobacteraceae bacterium]|jgi:hypothetical protein|nr:hypothetical protein [Campylobacteraceae bacterium]
MCYKNYLYEAYAAGGSSADLDISERGSIRSSKNDGDEIDSGRAIYTSFS